ncbi:polysaccharide pyruvyl transferase family protein [Bifidobacterium avesanii]|nr:polysaccharide pyruvyl transferase family protein [Bifidobacterium avesanii]
MGGLISNPNLGCVALTYSLLSDLEKVSKKMGQEFSYTIFEFEHDPKLYTRLRSYLHLPDNRLRFVRNGFLWMKDWKYVVKMVSVNHRMSNAIRSCDVVIDLTQGDSFTDIYGERRFYELTLIKEKVEKMSVPLILGPQTYGPFKDTKVRELAGKVIDRAQCVISRDEKSRDYLSTFTNKKVDVTTDLAFALPFDKPAKNSNRIRVGINPSGLLFSKKTEGTQLAVPLKTDYDRYLETLVERLRHDSRYEVHLIPHVGDDAVEDFRGLEGVICHDRFVSPIDAKNCIASMDVFVGSRMHATIAAFSSGVATIPAAYSRKFAGLYEALGYDHVIDLCALDTDAALESTFALIERHQALKDEVAACMATVQEKNAYLEQILERELRAVKR